MIVLDVLMLLPRIEQGQAIVAMQRRRIRLDAMLVVPHEAVFHLAFAGEIPAGQVNHPVNVVQIVGAHWLDLQCAGIKTGEQFFAGILDARSLGNLVGDVVIVHDFKGLRKDRSPFMSPMGGMRRVRSPQPLANTHRWPSICFQRMRSEFRQV